MYSSMGYQQLTGADAAQSLTVPFGTQAALLIVEGGAARWRDDGTAASATVGMPIAAGAPEYLLGFLPNVSIYLATGVNANVTYYGGV